ncbi:hypothetical protein ZIOFF_076077 [Zingiber officinale]|uniref:ATP synthase subunit epsilon, mitochondrial n=1 Tax=Zingiber officinale TaxID=94328 RepID=A0A8J5C0C8_ZINOF|nr:hypothetical protein ZIOFF_076077 [Zingiber officinale]
MASTGAAVPFWRAAGMTYISYSNICASLVRSCLKEPHRSTAAAREKVHFAISKWANGKPESPTTTEVLTSAWCLNNVYLEVENMSLGDISWNFMKLNIAALDVLAKDRKTVTPADPSDFHIRIEGPTLSAVSHAMDSVEESVCVPTPKLLVGVSLAGRPTAEFSSEAKVRASSRIGSGLTDEATLNEASFLVLGRSRNLPRRCFSYDEIRVRQVAFVQLLIVETRQAGGEGRRGGFAQVFKGTLRSGQSVAVKRLTKGNVDQQKEYKIAIGVARGLHYLHKCCSHRIVHRDIKASNVFLGPDFEPQVELQLNRRLSGRRPVDTSKQSLLVWAKKPLMETGKIDELVDPVFQGNYDRDQAQRLVLTASYRVRQSSFCRPYMTEFRLVPTQVTTLNQLDFLAMLIRIPCIGRTRIRFCGSTATDLENP